MLRDLRDYRGADGADGADGAQGPQGLPGTNGTDGADGADGAQGPQGLPGTDGVDGTDGADGAVGPQGPQGLPGADGADGVDGTEVSGTTGSIFFAGADGKITENNSQVFWDNTNNRLGIGTNSGLTNKLTVSGTTRTSGLNNSDGTAGSPSYRFTDDIDTGIYKAAADELGFSTNGSEAFRIDASGQVGVGTTTPAAQVDIESTGVPLRIKPSTSTPTGNSGGQMFVGDDGILYIYDGTRSKWLSVDRTMVGWGRNSNNTSNQYLRQFNGAQSNFSGWRMVRDGTITAITAQTNIAQTWTLEIRKNDAGTVITSLTMAAQAGNHNNTLNIDISEGDFIQAYCNGNSIDYPQTLIEIAWRK